MKRVHLLMVIFSFSVLNAMEKPASSADFLRAARRLREQIEQEQKSGYFEDLDNFIRNLFSSKQKKAASHNSPSTEDEIQKGIVRMNQALANWKKDPANPELRKELSLIQQTLISLQVKLLQQDKLQLMQKLNDEVGRVSKERDSILAERGLQPKPTMPVRSSTAPVAKPELRITQFDIKNALTQLKEKREKKRKPYVWGVRIGLAGTIAGLGCAAYSKSVQPVAVAGGFATLLVISAFAQDKLPEPTQADAIKFLEQPK